MAVLTVSMLLAVAGCSKDDGGSSSNPSPTPAPTVAPKDDAGGADGADGAVDDGEGGGAAGQGQGGGGQPAAGAQDLGTLKATAVFVGGKRPGRKVVDMAADPFCKTANAGKRVGMQNWLVNSKMQVANVVVFVKEGADGEYDPPEAAAKLDQNCCVYVPHVLTLMVDQPLTITNSDKTLHNVHSLAAKQPQFNKAQAKKGAMDTVKFRRPEFVKIKCDVHPWMSAFVAVFKHPYHAVTDKSGACTIDLPAGAYTIGAWHEETGELTTLQVTITAKGTTEITVDVK